MTQTTKRVLNQRDIDWIAFWLKANADDIKQQLKEEGYIIEETGDNKP